MNKENILKYVNVYKTKIGNITIINDGEYLTNITLNDNEIPSNSLKTENEIAKKTIKQIKEYLDGKRKEFSIPIKLNGTEFQKKVWQALQFIPYGETRSYEDIAKIINSPKACRSVGTANSRNPIAIIIPCHRVITKSGGLGGYAYGLEIKQKLLNIEKSQK